VAAGGNITKNKPRWLIGAGVLALGVALLVVFRWRQTGFDWALFSSTLLHVRWPWLLGACLIALATYYGRALRWAVMIRHLRPKPDIWGLFSATAIGFAAIMILGRPGELVRPYLIAERERVSFSSQLAIWLLERICDLLAALAIFAYALIRVGRSGAKVGPGLGWALAAGGYVAAIAALVSVAICLMLWRFPSLVERRLIEGLGFLPSRWAGKTAEMVRSFVSGVQLSGGPSGMLMLGAMTVLEWGLICLCYVALFQSFPAMRGFGAADVFILIGFGAFGSLVQLPGIGGGVQVVSTIVLMEIFHLPLEIAGGVALIFWLVTFVVIVPVGLILLVHQGINWRKIKEMKGVREA
jgi:hypothetical protein